MSAGVGAKENLKQDSNNEEPVYYDCLLVDDEEASSIATCEYFKMFDVSVFWAQDVDACKDFCETHTADLILLDVNLVDASGFDLCRYLRTITNVPILFISARHSDDDKLLALSIGGDDYIQKPYSLSVLLAKVKAVLARHRQSVERPRNGATLSLGELVLVEDELAVVRNGSKIDLKPMEFKLLRYLMKNSGRIITKDELFGSVWKETITSENTLNVHVHHLREKLEKDANDPQYIKTVWRVGYIFNVDEKKPE
jgi:two-component system response regulator RegX3